MMSDNIKEGDTKDNNNLNDDNNIKDDPDNVNYYDKNNINKHKNKVYVT